MSGCHALAVGDAAPSGAKGKPAKLVSAGRSTGLLWRLAQALGVLLTAVAVTAGAPRAQERNPLEMAIKAAFLYKFPLYVSWPERAFASPTSPFDLCVVGDDTFASLVDRAAAGQSVAGHPMTVLHLATLSASNQCQILYLATSDPGPASQVLATVDGLPVLTVTDGFADARARGIVIFVIASNRVRFEIDNATATHDGLAISSKLLSLALSVRSVP